MKDSRTFVQPWGFETQVSHQEKEKGKSFSFRETSKGVMIITTAAAVDADEAAITLLDGICQLVHCHPESCIWACLSNCLM